MARVGKNSELYARQRLYNGLIIAALCIAAAALVFGLWLTPLEVTGDSMSPCVRQNDLLLVDRLGIYAKSLRRADMVAYQDSSAEGGTALGRVIALSGETVQVLDGKVYINSQLLDESAYINPSAGNASDTASFEVPRGAVFLLPDTREDTLGVMVEKTRLLGTVRMRIAPYDSINIFA